jgi:hypothetical protein
MTAEFSSSGGATRDPARRIAQETIRKIRVEPKPVRRFVRSLMAPMICGENVSPKK